MPPPTPRPHGETPKELHELHDQAWELYFKTLRGCQALRESLFRFKAPVRDVVKVITSIFNDGCYKDEEDIKLYVSRLITFVFIVAFRGQGFPLTEDFEVSLFNRELLLQTVVELPASATDLQDVAEIFSKNHAWCNFTAIEKIREGNELPEWNGSPEEWQISIVKKLAAYAFTCNENIIQRTENFQGLFEQFEQQNITSRSPLPSTVQNLTTAYSNLAYVHEDRTKPQPIPQAVLNHAGKDIVAFYINELKVFFERVKDLNEDLLAHWEVHSGNGELNSPLFRSIGNHQRHSLTADRFAELSSVIGRERVALSDRQSKVYGQDLTA